VEGKLIPKLEYIQTMGFSYKEAVKIVTRFPTLFGYNIENNLKPKLEYLVHEMGRIVHYLKGFPQYFVSA
jgi:mTERF domain-containing protein